jgi:hypothetical protein
VNQFARLDVSAPAGSWAPSPWTWLDVAVKTPGAIPTGWIQRSHPSSKAKEEKDEMDAQHVSDAAISAI